MKQSKGKRRIVCMAFGGGTAVWTAAVLLQAAARSSEEFGSWYVSVIYPVLVNTLGRLSGWFPFSVAELLLYVLTGTLIGGFWRFRRKKKNYLLFIFCLSSVLVFSYTVCCGINYFSRPFSASLPYSIKACSREELSALLGWLTDQVNEKCEELYGQETAYSQAELGYLGVEAMQLLSEEYPVLQGFYPRPKPLVFSGFLSVQQLAGIYSPFTVEANYNQDMTAYNIPHTICHELSHLRGFMREDEANFIGFLACIGSPDAGYRYSGYLSGWIYAGNALAKIDHEAYRACHDRLDERVLEDFQKNREFWSRYESGISEAAETMNDTYLKANHQSDGVQSYGRAVDLMLAWYKAGV